MLIPDPDLVFLNSDPKIYFWANLGRKSQRCPFCWKISSHSISRMLIFIPTLVFWISSPISAFGKMWAEKIKAVCLVWKLAHMVSWRCWFQIRAWNFWNSDPKIYFWGPKFPELDLQNFDPEIHFLTSLGHKSHTLFILIWDVTPGFGHTASFGFIL